VGGWVCLCWCAPGRAHVCAYDDVCVRPCTAQELDQPWLHLADAFRM